MRHPVNIKHHIELTFGQKAAERLASLVGSWRFLIIQSLALAAWITLNVVAWARHWDAYPFILLNLMLSFQAAYTGPILLIAANRQSSKDRDLAEHTYTVELQLKELIEADTRITSAVHDLSKQIHDHIVGAQGERSSGQ